MMKRSFIPDWLFSLAAIALPYATIFDGQWIKFSGVDSYYYMRIVDNMLANFPQLMKFDPYAIYPGGSAIGGAPVFFAYILAGTIKLLGGAAPPQQTADAIAAFVPAVMGALLVIPVFFIGRALANRWAGLVAALLLALMPGQLLSRTLLGAADHHVAELFFTSFFMLFFILAIQHGRRFTYDLLRKGQFPPTSRHVPYSFIAGIFLGLYLVTWQGALMLVLILFIYFIVQFISDHLRGFPTDYLSKTAITCFLISLLIFLPVSRDKMTLLALAVIMLMPIALNIVSTIMISYKISRFYFVAATAALLIAGGLAAWLFFPTIFASATGYLYSFFSWRSEQNVVGEMKSLFFPGNLFTLETAWSEFALSLYTGLAGLALLVYQCAKKGEPGHIFTAVWSLLWLFFSFGMVRFAAYFSVCLALLTGYVAGSVIYALWPRRDGQAKIKPVKKNKRTAEQTQRLPAGRMTLLIILILALAAAMVPSAAGAIGLAKGDLSTPPSAWMEALQWMRKNTPEPFGSEDYYYRLYLTPAAGKAYDYPSSAYGVAVWSDYGYWVTRIGHRIPTSNPGSYPIYGNYPNSEANYFLSAENSDSGKRISQWGAKYVIVDGRIASPNDKFYALANLSGKNEADYYELCWQKKDGKYVPLLVFYPDFYRTTVIRLYNFDGKLVAPQNTMVMAWQEQALPDGQKFKEIIGFKKFNAYDEAQAFISSQKSGNYRIIGTDPLSSPVPLEQLDGYKLVYQTNEKASAGSSPLPVIKIFEYNP
ncbi:MAG: oligosaccharyl transferase, archaeosortase A system-associated [Chloroflexi bacterium]|nr:oligosaccharyl transferase, archaeosortase A system-associated [Chloroflexota bacterium]